MSTTDELLFAEQATTSLYESLYSPDEKRVLSLSQAKATYCTLDGATLREPGDGVVRARAQAPEIVVQVRKRNRKVELLIDGYVSTGVPEQQDGNVTNHYLRSHNGMQEDIDTRSRVFSPIAVVAAVEDGQHPFQRVDVAVVYNYANFGTVTGPSTVLSEARVVDHRVDDVRCSVVRVPYPLPYPNPPTLDLFDNMDLVKYEQIQQGNFAWARNAATLATVGTTLSLLMDGITGVPPLAAAIVVAATGGAAGAVGLVAQSVFNAGWAFPAALILGSIPFTPAILATLDAAGAGTMYLILPLLGVIGPAFKKYIDMKEPPKLRTTRFTLAELATAIEGLSVRRGPENDALPEVLEDKSDAQKSTQYKREERVWRWLTDAGGKDVPGLDLAHLVATAEYVAQLHLRITVDDALSCDAKTHTHNIRCGRDDGPTLAAAAGGTVEDLLRLYAAIEKLKTVLVGATSDDPAVVANATNGHDLWVDRDRFNVLRYTLALKRRIEVDIAAMGDAGANVAQNVGNFRLRGARRQARAAYVQGWIAANNPYTNDRAAMLKEVLANLEKRLIAPLFAAGSAGARLYVAMDASLNDRRNVVITAPPATWIRRLPQRAVSTYGNYLFSAVRDAGSAQIEVDVGTAMAILNDEYGGAVKWLTECMKSSRQALKRLVPEWESSSSTRVQLLCMCTSINDNTEPFVDAVAHSTLSLTTPVDIAFAGALTSPTEHSQRRIRVIVKRNARGGAEQESQSVLEALKLEHSDAYLLACNVFGDVWADELVALYMSDGNNHKQTEMLEMASVRAAARLRAAGELLLELVRDRNPSATADAFDDVALGGADVALVATQPGRDAGRLVSRLLFSQNYLAIRAAMVPVIRASARAAVRTAAAFDRAVPTTLPHEACASLFGDRLDGARAFLRAKDLSDDPVVHEAICAAYPSTHLLDDTALEAARNSRGNNEPQPRSLAITVAGLVRAMRFRLASLRMDTKSLDTAVASPTLISTDELAERLTATSISPDAPACSFYVPFGFGDARPPPTMPPCATPLFGTVPIYGPALVAAFRSIAMAVSLGIPAPPPGARRPFFVRLEPVFDCLRPSGNDRTSDETESVHPNVLMTSRNGNVVVVQYTASRMPHMPPPVDAPAGSERNYRSAALAASAHVRSADTAQLALAVSAIAWNAERVAQAVVAALASADEDEPYDHISLELVMPESDTRTSHWYSRPPNPMAIAQTQRRLENVESMQRVIIDGTLVRQRGLMAAAIEKANAIDRSVLQSENRAALVESILDEPQGQAPADTFAQRLNAFQNLFDVPTIQAIDSAIPTEAQPLPVPSDSPDGQGQEPDTDRIRMGFQAAILAAEEYAFPDLRISAGPLLAAQPAVPDVANPQQQPLLAALGVGMALLAPQVEPLAVACAHVRSDGDNRLATDSVNALAAAFANCSAMRLSEACLVASRSV
tara:strand:+ start:2213 stop:6541 length:4329 start_codon:yes stop_codon:yes gene_type:complete